MPEPTNELTPEVEVVTLRKVRDELLTKTHVQKARIAELESEAVLLTEKADKAQALVQTAVVDVPLQRMVAELSNSVPALVVRELLEDFTFEAGEDGAIVVKTKADGKPIAAKDGKPVEWNKLALHLYLIGHAYKEQSDRQRMYGHLLGIPAGSGGLGRKLPMPGLRAVPGEENKAAFGLR